jgi:hypothetical protein
MNYITESKFSVTASVIHAKKTTFFNSTTYLGPAYEKYMPPF